MSGGSMDYLSFKVEQAEFRDDTVLRRAFRKHLNSVAVALHEIEWADSSDTLPGDRDVDAMNAVLGKRAELEQLIEEASEVMEMLAFVLQKAREKPEADDA